MLAPPCLHCKQEAELTSGCEVYPHLPDLHQKPIWICRNCAAYCGCHPGTNVSLGYPANRDTRQARMKLHNLRLDPLWKKDKRTGRKGPFKRSEVYLYLQRCMHLAADEAHTGMFTIEQCREAWAHLGALERYGRSALEAQVIE